MAEHVTDQDVKKAIDVVTFQKLAAEADAAEIEKERARLKLEQEQRADEIDAQKPYRTGRFVLYGVVGSSMDTLRQEIMAYAATHEGADIELTICTPGGGTADGFHLYDILRELSRRGHKIITVASGWAASMGSVLLQAGDHRVMSSESVLMIHEPWHPMPGNSAGEVEDTSERLNTLKRQICAILARRARLNAEAIYDRIDRREWWLSPNEALGVGFIDEIRVS